MRSLLRLLHRALLVALLPAAASAHLIWVHVLPGATPHVEIVFGDGVHQDTDPNLIGYVAELAAWIPGGPTLALEQHPWGLAGNLPAGTDLVAARKAMGLFQRPGQDTAVKLDYEAKGATNVAAAGRELGLETELLARVDGSALVLSLRFRGAPAPGGTIFVTRFDAPGLEELTADEHGELRVPRPPHGVFSAKGRVVVPLAGELDGKPYTAEHHYALLTISSAGAEEPAPEGELEAWQRLEETGRFAARLPDDVVGLAGVLYIRLDGDAHRGEFEVKGGALVQCDVEGVSDEDRAFVAAEVTDMVAPLLARELAALRFPLELAPRDGHPEGRLVRLSDPAKTTYRVLEGEVRAVEDVQSGERRVRHVLASMKTADGRFLPTQVARCVFDAESQALLRTETTVDEYKERDGLMLPSVRRALVARDGLCRSVVLELRNLEVERAAAPAGAPLEAGSAQGAAQR